MPLRLDAVDVAVRESTRLASVQRSRRDGANSTQDQLRRLKEQYVALDSEQEHVLHREAEQLHELLHAATASEAVPTRRLQ